MRDDDAYIMQAGFERKPLGGVSIYEFYVNLRNIQELYFVNMSICIFHS